MELIIRSAAAADAVAIGALAKQFADYLRTLGDETEFNLNAAAILRDGFGPWPAFHGLVAEEGDRIIGYLLYHFGYDSDAAARILHIADLYVDAKTRRRGVGRALMAASAKIAGEAAAREMVWSVYHANKLATRFYEELGAERVADVFFMKLRTDAL